MLTQERLKELLDYDPETGVFRWKVDRGGKRAGMRAGVVRDTRYRIIGVDDKLMREHQLAWLYMTGEWPPKFIDHINMDKADNRWSNLRLATKSQNQANMPVPKHNTSGLKGAHRHRAGEAYGKPWQSAIQIDGKNINLGHFATAKEAHDAYVAAAKKLFGEFARAG